MQLTICSKPAVHNLLQVCSTQLAASLQFASCSKSAVHNLQQVCRSQLAASLQFTTCSKSADRNLQQVCSSQLAASLQIATCSKSAIRSFWLCSTEGKIHYVPHQAVVRKNARTTKARFPLGEFVRATRSENKNSAT